MPGFVINRVETAGSDSRELISGLNLGKIS
jgi:hypothetical protein